MILHSLADSSGITSLHLRVDGLVIAERPRWRIWDCKGRLTRLSRDREAAYNRPATSVGF